jgi:hypothetical protein
MRMVFNYFYRPNSELARSQFAVLVLYLDILGVNQTRIETRRKKIILANKRSNFY